ncbi:MAG: DUF192 domain-containing protein [Chloroflexota bacterium]|nr:DUF192 domain-containing protein [Chloroflexota bacterium]
MAATELKVFSIRNADRGTVLATRAKLASSFLDRFFGLMGRKGVEEGGGLLLLRSASIHSFFMRFRFDAVFLDRERRVVKIVPAMRQWWIAFGGRGAKDVLELPAGVAATTGTQPGDLLTLEEPVAD